MVDEIFLKKMKGVKPLKKEDILKSQKTTINKDQKIKKIISERYEESKETNLIKKNSDFKIVFSEINRDLKKGKVNIDRKVDLHGYSILEAEEKFKKEIINSYKKGYRCLLFITGKGLFVNKYHKDIENEKPNLFYGKIKKSILNWVHEPSLQRYIMTFQKASFEYGGDGAIFVYLRKNKA